MSKLDLTEEELHELVREVLLRLARDPTATELWQWCPRPGCDDEPAGLSRRKHLQALLAMVGLAATPLGAVACDAEPPTANSPGVRGDTDGDGDGTATGDGTAGGDNRTGDGHAGDPSCSDDPCGCADDPCSCADDPCGGCADDPCSCADDPCGGCADDPCSCSDDPCGGCADDPCYCADDPCGGCADDPCG